MASRGVFGSRTSSAHKLLPGETVLYGRKSKKDESASKSLGDQCEVCLETCEEYDIPATEADFWAERPGHGGDEWYEGVTLYEGVKLEQRPQTRPVLTKIVQGVIAGTIRCIVVYSQCRLWRSVAICSALIDLLAKHNVLLFDRNGQVDISTPEGRNAVLQNAVAAQNYREVAAVNAPRGVTKSRNKGKLVGNPNVLGFRGVGGKTGKVIVIPEEVRVVQRCFDLFDKGEGGNGPLSAHMIAKKLTTEGYELPKDLQERRNFRRHKGMNYVFYGHFIRKLLANLSTGFQY